LLFALDTEVSSSGMVERISSSAIPQPLLPPFLLGERSIQPEDTAPP